jgi:hypothetical protein
MLRMFSQDRLWKVRMGTGRQELDLMIPPISAFRLETALADSHVFARLVVRLSVLSVNPPTFLSAASLAECVLTATSLRLHSYAFGVQMKSWHLKYIFSVVLGHATSHAGGVRPHKISTLQQWFMQVETWNTSARCRIPCFGVKYSVHGRHKCWGKVLPKVILSVSTSSICR